MALWRRNGEERASETPKAPTKVEVVGYWPNVEKEVEESRDMRNIINVLLQRCRKGKDECVCGDLN